jgi:hypothetical protein
MYTVNVQDSYNVYVHKFYCTNAQCTLYKNVHCTLLGIALSLYSSRVHKGNPTRFVQ